MSERKVLNKYYPADFDPTKIPRMKREKNAMYTIRIMAPFNMRCNTCGEYIYKGKKFNSRKETVEDETYLGLYIFRFYIRCPRCIAVIAFKTDPENTDYTLEAGATRNFEAARTAQELAVKEAKEKEDEEANNPMKVLENRTKASQNEMAMLETLEELKDLNKRQANVDYESMVEKYRIYEEQLKQLQDVEDEKFIKSVFGEGSRVRRLEDDEDEQETEQPLKKVNKLEKPTDILAQETSKKPNTKSQKTKLMGLVKRKQPTSSSDVIKEAPSSTVSVDIETEETVINSDSVSNKEEIQKDVQSNTHISSQSSKNCDETGNHSSTVQNKATPSGLSLLGNYSDSDNSESD